MSTMYGSDEAQRGKAESGRKGAWIVEFESTAVLYRVETMIVMVK